jgi:hypothetical protein
MNTLAKEQEASITFRVASDLRDRLDALVPHVEQKMRDTTGRANASRSDVIRIALMRGVEALERDAKREQK